MRVRKDCKKVLSALLLDYVKEHGEPLNDYYRNEFGIEPDDGEEIVSVLNVSDPGCFFALQYTTNDDLTKEQVNNGNLKAACYDGFCHYAFWAFYVAKDSDGNETLWYYMFYNSGIAYDDDAEPEHDRVELLDIAAIDYIVEALWKAEQINEKKK